MGKTGKSGLLNASERDGVQYRKASIPDLFMGMANRGTNTILYMVIGFASLVAPQGYGIPTAIAGIILTVTRWADGVSDAVVAALFERFNPPKGKIRIMFTAGWAVAVLGAMLLYNWAAGKFEGVLGIVVFVVIYLLFDIGNTMQGITGNTVGTVITNDPTQRPMTGLLSTIYSYCVPLICTNVITFVILPKYDMQYNLPMLAETVYWFAGISFIFVVLSCIGVRKIDVQETFEKLPEEGEEEQKKATLREMWAVIKDNRNVQMYMLTAVSDRLAQQTMTQSVVMTLMNGVLIGSFAATTMVSNFSQIIGVTFALFGGLLAAKYG